MTLSDSNLGRRLQLARENSRLSQEDVADALGVPRTGVAKMEAGRRTVSSLELAELARLYNRPIAWFVGEETEPEEDVFVALLRLAPEIDEDTSIREEVSRYLRLCQEGCRLREMLGLTLDCTAPGYSLPMPSHVGEAVRQGERVASEERSRIGIGDAPISDMADLIVNQGIWASGVRLPSSVSGLLLRHRSIGFVVLVALNELRERKRFSYAHEYAHALMDRDGSATVSRNSDRNNLTEVRANAFAAAFLMPAEGVREFVTTIGKGRPSRESFLVTDGSDSEDEPQATVRRHSARDQRITYMDVIAAAHHFKVNYEPMLYRLRNLGLITQDELASLREKKSVANDVRNALGLWNNHNHPTDEDAIALSDRNLEAEVLELAIEAFRREEISAGKLRELATLLDLEGGPDQVLDFAEAAAED